MWSKHQPPMLLFHIVKSIGDIPIKAFLFHSHEVDRLLTDFKKQVIIAVLQSESPWGAPRLASPPW